MSYWVLCRVYFCAECYICWVSQISLYAECRYAEYDHAECRYAECRGALIQASFAAASVMKHGV